ncbi:GNAT family N-acetyltransferase [Flagellimonas nanhaiensis]|uniref:N-acetyltransferase n=1 Tax=Flagellimonas nanhaiensis TaxID=2292706 RepID=A0A371JRF8_9FLAO|nr:GNAT family N-acetyltransferase [Allomuricauda nanhaiensis]RDY60098.1 N-acetyltransferase [Allomuricauda nanhaiensis]
MSFNFTKDYVLENDRVRLVPLEEEHFELLQDIAREKELWTYFLGKSNGYADFERYVKNALEGRTAKKEYSFAVFDKRHKKYAGSTRFFDYDADLNTIRLGYTWYGKDFRGSGLNKNCKYLLFRFAFEQMGFERIGLGAHAENKVSLAAMRSVGCIQEGVVRNLFPSIRGQGRSHAVLLGILKKEWFNTAKENLKNKL